MPNNLINVAPLIIRAFDGLFQSVVNHDYNNYWMEGGRGSTKSSFIAICIVILVVTFPWANATIVRRFSNTLRDSVYQQMLWAIAALGLDRYFKASLSPLEIVYKPTGQRIVFRGLDDPLKSKGAVFKHGYNAIQWFEELDQCRSWEDVSSALKSYRRGGDIFWSFYSYNPPKTLWSWVNQKALEMRAKPDSIVNHSTYLDVIDSGCAQWLGQLFIDDAEYLKDTNLQAYKWEMLGEITGTGGNVFDNIVERKITDEEIATFDNPRNGVDWGWFPDPWRFIRCEYQKREKRLIVFDEYSRNKMLPEDTADIVIKGLTYPKENPIYHKDVVWYDDTPDGKVQGTVYRRKGINARPAQKGGMRMYSYQRLAGLREIVIDQRRCPLTYQELMLKEYDKDKAGSYIDSIPDGNDHSIDAIRYAMMRDFKRSA